MCDLCERKTTRLTPLQCHTHIACAACVKTWSIHKNGRKVVACPICTDPDVIIDPLPTGKTKRRRESAPQPIDTGCYEDLEGYNNDVERLLNPTAPKPRRSTEPTFQVDRLSSASPWFHQDEHHAIEPGYRPLIKYDPTTGKAIKYFPYRNPSKERERAQPQPTPGVNVKDIIERLEMRDMGRISAMISNRKTQHITPGNRSTTRAGVRNRTEKEEFGEEWDFPLYTDTLTDFASTALPSAANNWGADTVETLCASAWLKPMDLKIDSASVAAYSDTTAEYGSDDDKFTVHNSSRHTFVIDDDDEEDNEAGRRSGDFFLMPDSDDEGPGSGERGIGGEQERNSSPCKAKRGNNPIDWIPNTPLPDVERRRPSGLNDDEEEDPVPARLVDETGSLPNVRAINDDDESGLTIDGPGFYGSDNQLFGPDMILVKAVNDASLEDFWST